VDSMATESGCEKRWYVELRGCESSAAPRYGRERGEIREATELREIIESLVIGTIRRPAEVKELAGSP
jgi:hypothetical protein